MKLCNLITVDTRPGWLADSSFIGEYGKANLEGCRSIDFFGDGIRAKQRFLESELAEAYTVVSVDQHHPEDMRIAIQQTVPRNHVDYYWHFHDRKGHRWNDRIYLYALRKALLYSPDILVKWDGDATGYRREGFDLLAHILQVMDETGAAYVCQQTPLNPNEHGMKHASTRFFVCKASTLDLDKAEWLLNDNNRRREFPGRHLPCLEHILGAMCGDRVFYPPADYDKWVVWSWVKYFKGTLGKLNAMPYDQILEYITECGGLHGAADLIGKPI